MADTANDPYADLKSRLPTEPAGPDPERLASIAVEIRRHVNVADPKSIYFGRQDLADAAELQIKTTLLRAGVTEPAPETPLARAQRQHDAAFSAEMPENLATTLDGRLAKLEPLGTPAIERMAGDLRERLGATEYAALVRDAGNATTEPLPAAAMADEPTLRILAAYGRHRRIGRETRPRG